VLLIQPVGFHLGLGNAYLSHNLYSSKDPEVRLCEGPGTVAAETECPFAPYSTWDSLNLPMPPDERLFIARFRIECRAGDTLVITEPRTRLASDEVTRVEC